MTDRVGVYLSLSDVRLPQCAQDHVGLLHQLRVRPLTLQSPERVLPTQPVSLHYTPRRLTGGGVVVVVVGGE